MTHFSTKSLALDCWWWRTMPPTDEFFDVLFHEGIGPGQGFGCNCQRYGGDGEARGK